jgi:hypothetical protein
MKRKLFNSVLLFALFGIALGFFGILYEGLVYGPKMLGDSKERMLFWKQFYEFVSPVIFYIPLNPLATITLAILAFNTPEGKPALRNRLRAAVLFQVGSFLLTFYIIKIIDLKTAFSDIAQYATVIPAKTALFNCLSVIRIGLSALSLAAVFRGYLFVQKEEDAG